MYLLVYIKGSSISQAQKTPALAFFGPSRQQNSLLFPMYMCTSWMECNSFWSVSQLKKEIILLTILLLYYYSIKHNLYHIIKKYYTTTNQVLGILGLDFVYPKTNKILFGQQWTVLAYYCGVSLSFFGSSMRKNMDQTFSLLESQIYIFFFQNEQAEGYFLLLQYVLIRLVYVTQCTFGQKILESGDFRPKHF